ncbi:hypothetical protein [Bosea sp. OAE752]|uniref:hypothetical protein n=1 Tax=Bosea sp. OAE752 TaxID=2663873 RepID=UPI003D1F4BB8
MIGSIGEGDLAPLAAIASIPRGAAREELRRADESRGRRRGRQVAESGTLSTGIGNL